MRFEAIVGPANSSKKVEIEQLGEGKFRINGIERTVDIHPLESGGYSLIFDDGSSYEVVVREEKKGFSVAIGAHLIPVRLHDPASQSPARAGVGIAGDVVISSPMPGRVVAIKVEVGQEVVEGQGVVVVEAMKMENELHSPKTGKIKKIDVKVGQAVESGQDLLVIE